MQKIINALLVVLLLSTTTAKASQIDTETTYKGKISVSLLTVSPGNQIYEKFGHTGIRIQIPSKKFDGVYHYGLFSFEDPNFEYRFVKGETDYMIGLMHYHDFLTMYAIRGSSVRELPINLTNEEALNLFEALQINMLPENATYRYSFLYDNCATRPLDIIFKNIKGNIILDTEGIELPTFRELIHECTQQNKWLTFGLDLILGGEVDEKISLPDRPFLPHITEQILHSTKVDREGAIEKLTTEPRLVLKEKTKVEDRTIADSVNPNTFTLILLLVVILISIIEYKKSRHYMIVDTIIYLVCGVLGILVYFLLIFSEHPAVSSNINAMWLHPIWLIMIPILWIRKAQKFLYYYHFINFALLMLYLIAIVFVKQEIPMASILLVLVLLIRTIKYMAIELNQKNFKFRFIKNR